MNEKLPPGIVEMVAPGIGRKEDGGLVYYDWQGYVIMESHPNGIPYEDVYHEKPEDNPARAYIFENTITGAHMEFPHGVKIRPDPEREGYTKFTALPESDSVENKPLEGNAGHGTFVQHGYLYLTNYDDPFYVQRFDNWAQLREFIAELEKAGKDAFGD